MDPDFFAAALDQVSDGVYALDGDRRITYWNAGSESISGYAAAEVLGRSCAAGILRHVDDAGRELCATACPMVAVMKDGQSRAAELYLHHRDGHRLPVAVRAMALRDASDGIVGALEVFSSSAGNRYAEQPAGERDSGLDPVTGLEVRSLGERRLSSLLAGAGAGTDGASLGVLFVDADRFKAVNDTFGHPTGDRALRMVGQSIAGGLRRGDLAIRWGGEEFLALLPDVDAVTLGSIAERVRMLVEHSWIQQGSDRVRVTVSVGATLARPGESIAALLERVDAHMYASKRGGRNRVTTDEGERPASSAPVAAPDPIAEARALRPDAPSGPVSG